MSTDELPPTPPFAMGEVATELYHATAPLTFEDAALGFPWATYLQSLGLIIEDEMILTGGDGAHEPWTALADPQRCPADWLGVLAQWAGLRNRSAYSEAELRALLGPHAPGLWRGTVAAMTAAARRFIGPTAPLFFEERAEGDPYLLRIFTYDFSGGDPVQIAAALYAAKPAGLTLEYEVRVGQTYGMMLAKHPLYSDVLAAYETYGDAVADRPTTGSS